MTAHRSSAPMAPMLLLFVGVMVATVSMGGVLRGYVPSVSTTSIAITTTTTKVVNDNFKQIVANMNEKEERVKRKETYLPTNIAIANKNVSVDSTTNEQKEEAPSKAEPDLAGADDNKANDDRGSGKEVTKSTSTETCNLADYKGILLITHIGFAEGFGTAYFGFVLDQLLYADMYNLVPLILPNNVSLPCYDVNVHHLSNTSFAYSTTVQPSKLMGTGDMECRTPKLTYHHPGPPLWNESNTTDLQVVVTGNSVWNTYFQDFPCHDELLSSSPTTLPVMNLQDHMTPFIHRCAPWALRAWPFKRLPKALMPIDDSLHEWFAPMRASGAILVERYMKLQPWLQERIVSTPNDPCLAVHIRATDKGGGRKLVPWTSFWSYIEIYLRQAIPKSHVYVATDSVEILEKLLNNTKNDERIIRFQQEALRSNDSVPTFTMSLTEGSTHRTNTEALVDIYNMASCNVILHGHSAMAEAVVYLNPSLHNRSVNLDDSNRLMTEEAFTELLKTVI